MTHLFSYIVITVRMKYVHKVNILDSQAELGQGK